MLGVDYTSGPSVVALKAESVAFVCRYLCVVNPLTKAKILTPEEAQALSRGGLFLVSNYEWYASRAREGAASGKKDAETAAAQHANCGGPADRPIFFSVDEDVEGAQVADYFRGVASVIGLSRTGAYGSYKVIKYLFDNRLTAWGWQTYAWSAGEWDERAQLRQEQNSKSIGGHAVDYDRSIASDFGQWQVGGKNAAMMTIDDPWAKAFFVQTATSPERWHCASTGQDLFAGLLAGWQLMNGAPRLPTGGEVKCGNVAVYQECESGIVVYDPEHELDSPGGPWEPCYLLKFDAPLAHTLLNSGTSAPAPAVDTSAVEADLTKAETDLGKL